MVSAFYPMELLHWSLQGEDRPPPFEGSQYPALGQRKDPDTFCASLPPWTIQILHFLKHHEIPSSTEGQQPGQWHLTAETGGDREALDTAL